jgi:protein SCO1
MILRCLLLLFCATAFAHEGNHGTGSKSAPDQLPGGSLYHLPGAWRDQDNQKITLAGLTGSPRIVAMVYTKCPSACPLFVDRIQSVLARLPDGKRKRIKVNLFSMDSENETAATASAFMKKRRLDPAQWTVLYGDAGVTAELAAALGVRYKKLPTGDYVHSNLIFLLNERGEIASRFEGLGPMADAFVRDTARAIDNSYGPSGS